MVFVLLASPLYPLSSPSTCLYPLCPYCIHLAPIAPSLPNLIGYIPLVPPHVPLHAFCASWHYLCPPYIPLSSPYPLSHIYTRGCNRATGGIRNTRGVKGNIRGVQRSTLRPIMVLLHPCVFLVVLAPLLCPLHPLVLVYTPVFLLHQQRVQDEYMEAPEGVMEVQGDAREHNRNVRGTRGPQGVQRSPLYSPMSPFTLCTRGIKCVERA